MFSLRHKPKQMFTLLMLLFCVTVSHSLAERIELTSNCTGRPMGTACKMESEHGICVGNICLTSLAPEVRLKIVVKYPEENRYAKELQTDTSGMWIRGEGLGLSWQEGLKMTKVAKDTWETVLNFRASMDSYRCKNPTKTGMCNKIELRIRTGQDKTDMLGANFVRSLPISKWSLAFKRPPILTVYPWFFSKMGEVKKENVVSPELGQERAIQIYLPPSFKENVYKPYKVLFLNDGQVMNIGVAVLQLDMKITSQLLNEFVMVGVENNATERTSLLAPSNGTSVECKNGTLADGCNHCNMSCMQFGTLLNCSKAEVIAETSKCLRIVPKAAKGEKYLDFIQYSLLTHVHLKYRAQNQQKHVGIMGYSLGGLISCHAAWTRPTVFGSAVCSSPSFWWPVPLGKVYPYGAEFEFLNKTLSKFQDKRPIQRIYIDMGSTEIEFLMVEPSKTVANRMAATPYFEFDRNLWLQILDKQVHSMEAFLKRMWQPLYTLYGSEGSVRMESSTASGVASAMTASLAIIFLSILASLQITSAI